MVDFKNLSKLIFVSCSDKEIKRDETFYNLFFETIKRKEIVNLFFNLFSLSLKFLEEISTIPYIR